MILSTLQPRGGARVYLNFRYSKLAGTGVAAEGVAPPAAGLPYKQWRTEFLGYFDTQGASMVGPKP